MIFLQPTNKRVILAQPRVPITITMPDGSIREGTAWETSPMDIAKSIAKSLAERVVIAKVHTAQLICRKQCSRGIFFVMVSPQIDLDTEPRTDHKESRQKNTIHRKRGRSSELCSSFQLILHTVYDCGNENKT